MLKNWWNGSQYLPKMQWSKGLTLVELLLSLLIMGVLVVISLPSYQKYLENKDISLAKADISGIENCIERFYIETNHLPSTLQEGGCARKDPWKNNYEYLNISTVHGLGHLRKDHSQNPINTFYDLYSKGKDGRSASPLTAAISRDDIVRANDGGFIGLAEDY